MSIARVRLSYCHNPLGEINDLRRSDFGSHLKLRNVGLDFFIRYEDWVASEQSRNHIDAGFFIGRNEESLLPINLLIDKANLTKLGKLVRVSSA